MLKKRTNVLLHRHNAALLGLGFIGWNIEGFPQSNREKKEDLVATSRAERGIARHVLVVPRRTRDCPFHPIDGLEAHPTGITGWKPVLPFWVTLRSYPLQVQNF